MSADFGTDDGLLVTTDTGQVRGVVDRGVRTWRGIPFAAPPTGSLRYRGPQPAHPWTGVRDGGAFGSIPMQTRGYEVIGGAGRKTPISEDCLTINVSAPRTLDAGKRPVIVWIYGGGYTVGGSRADLYRGDRLVSAGEVIYVSFNYRLGIFGFIDFTSWSSPSRPIESNLGLRDQVAALEWVKRNISAFGGDPSNVTIFGQSAGGAAVLSLMCTPAARGLFHRAFAMSPAGSTCFGRERHARWARELLERLDINPENKAEVGDKLTKLSPERMIDVASRYFYRDAPDKYPGALPSSPVIDGDFLPKTYVDAFADGSAQRLPLVIGTASREGAILDKILTVLPTRLSRMEAMFRDTDPEAGRRIGAAYPGYPSHRRAIDIAGDMIFWIPSVRIADAHSQASSTWTYRFDYATPLTKMFFLDATHGADLTMLFGTTGEGFLGLSDFGRRKASKEISVRFQRAFLDFAKKGDPGWTQYDAVKRTVHVFQTEDTYVSDPRQDRRVAWGDYRGPE